MDLGQPPKFGFPRSMVKIVRSFSPRGRPVPKKNRLYVVWESGTFKVCGHQNRFMCVRYEEPPIL